MPALAQHAVLDTPVSVTIDPAGRVTRGHTLRVGNQGAHVVLFVDGRPIPMRTKQAVELCLTLARSAETLDCMRDVQEIGFDAGVVLVTIGREQVAMWPNFARRLSGSLARHADTVDDWQLANTKRIAK